MARPLASDKRAILGVLLTKEFEGRDEIEAQLANVTVEPIPGDPISLWLRIAEDAPRAGVRGRVPTDAFGYDADGNLVGILLHVLDGYANELEFFAAERDVRPGLPAPDTVKVAEWSEPDSSGLSVSLNSPPPSARDRTLRGGEGGVGECSAMTHGRIEVQVPGRLGARRVLDAAEWPVGSEPLTHSSGMSPSFGRPRQG